MPTPLVSVIIPTYNGERFISEAINSVLYQTYPNVELVVVDDGSSDRTPQILKTFEEKIILFQQENQGVAAARNMGLKISQGEFIAFLDQDDRYLREKISAQVSCLEQNPEIGWLNSGWNITKEDGLALSSVKPWHGISNLDLFAWIVWKPVFLGAMLFRRQWVENIGGFETTLQQTSDVDLALRLAIARCPSMWLKEITVNYRQHSQNTSLQVHQQAEELLTVLSKLFSRSDLPAPVRKLELQSLYQSLVWCAWRFYHYGFYQDMADYLERSLSYTNQPSTATLSDWVKHFREYSSEYGRRFNIDLLNQNSQWIQLLKRMH